MSDDDGDDPRFRVEGWDEATQGPFPDLGESQRPHHRPPPPRRSDIQPAVAPPDLTQGTPALPQSSQTTFFSSLTGLSGQLRPSTTTAPAPPLPHHARPTDGPPFPFTLHPNAQPRHPGAFLHPMRMQARPNAPGSHNLPLFHPGAMGFPIPRAPRGAVLGPNGMWTIPPPFSPPSIRNIANWPSFESSSAGPGDMVPYPLTRISGVPCPSVFAYLEGWNGRGVVVIDQLRTRHRPLSRKKRTVPLSVEPEEGEEEEGEHLQDTTPASSPRSSAGFVVLQDRSGHFGWDSMHPWGAPRLLLSNGDSPKLLVVLFPLQWDHKIFVRRILRLFGVIEGGVFRIVNETPIQSVDFSVDGQGVLNKGRRATEVRLRIDLPPDLKSKMGPRTAIFQLEIQFHFQGPGARFPPLSFGFRFRKSLSHEKCPGKRWKHCWIQPVHIQPLWPQWPNTPALPPTPQAPNDDDEDLDDDGFGPTRRRFRGSTPKKSHYRTSHSQDGSRGSFDVGGVSYRGLKLKVEQLATRVNLLEAENDRLRKQLLERETETHSERSAPAEKLRTREMGRRSVVVTTIGDSGKAEEVPEETVSPGDLSEGLLGFGLRDLATAFADCLAGLKNPLSDSSPMTGLPSDYSASDVPPSPPFPPSRGAGDSYSPVPIGEKLGRPQVSQRELAIAVRWLRRENALRERLTRCANRHTEALRRLVLLLEKCFGGLRVPPSKRYL